MLKLSIHNRLAVLLIYANKQNDKNNTQIKIVINLTGFSGNIFF